MGFGNAMIRSMTLGTDNWSASGTKTFNFQNIPNVREGKFVNILGFEIIINASYTFASGNAPGIVAAMNGLLAGLVFRDNNMFRFNGSGNTLIAINALRSGGALNNILPPAQASTATTRYRLMLTGPSNMAGSPDDFTIPVGQLVNGNLQFTYGTLAAFGNNISAVTATYTVNVLYTLSQGTLVSPPQWTIEEFNIGQTYIAPNAAAYLFMALMKTDYSAFATGDVGNLNVDFGAGPIYQTFSAPKVTDLYNAQFAQNIGTGIMGEPYETTDTPFVVRNAATSIAAVTANLQPIVWTPPQGRITKVPVSQAATQIQTTGSLTSFKLITERIIPRTPTNIAADQIAARGTLPGSLLGSKVRTLSGKPFKGMNGMGPYMPLKVQIG